MNLKWGLSARCTFLWKLLWQFRGVFMFIGMHTTHYKSLTFSLKTSQSISLEIAGMPHICCSRFFCTEQGISSNLNDISLMQISLNQINHISYLSHYSHKLQSLLVTPWPYICMLSRAWWVPAHLAQGQHRSLFSQEHILRCWEWFA